MQEIRRAIVTGGLQPGARLTEGQLATSLNVSRPTMREAITQLSQEGLLVQEPYRGLRVAALDPISIRDTARTRLALDTLAIEDILADPTGRRLDLVLSAWKAYDRLPYDADPLEAHQAHVAFHRAIWEASENTMLIRLWPVTEAHITLIMATDQATRRDPRRAHDQHETLVKAIAARDQKRIHAALVSHTIDSAEELIQINARQAE
jgi:DNA-binding GntR family transcriptional regulator